LVTQFDSLYNGGTGVTWPFIYTPLYNPIIGIHKKIYANDIEKKPFANNVLKYFLIPSSNYIPSDDFTIYNSWDFESEELGSYTNDEIRADFDIISLFDHSTGSIANDVINGQATKVLKVTHAAESLPYDFDCEVQLDEYDEIYMSYNIKFSNEFNSTEGGKIPGLSGSPAIIALVYPEPEEGFSAINMWKQRGKIISYNADRTREYVPWAIGATNTTDSIYFNNGTWYNVTQRLKMNTFTGGVANADGIKELWIDGKLFFKETNRKFMVTESSTYKIDDMHIASWYGGSAGQGYEPMYECYNYFDNFKIWINTEDSTYGTFNTHEYGDILSTPAEITDRTLYCDQEITVEGALSNSEYGDGVYSPCIDEAYIIDAGVGNTVTFTITAEITGGDYIYVLDGNQTDSPILWMMGNIGYNTISNHELTSTGRYLYIRFSTDRNYSDADGFIGTIQFN
jgi:hypothetical protein